jgi:hypothetical protein
MLQTLLILVTLIIGTIGVFRPEKRKKLWRITIISLLVLSAIIQARITIIARQKNQELEGIRDYTDISKLDQSGKPFVVGGGIKYSTGISRIMEGTYKEHDGIVYFECDDESLKRYKRAIQEYPRFPFSYVAIAHCLMRDGDNNWREYASKAISIFEITTRIGGHDKSHELAMEQLLRLLNE